MSGRGKSAGTTFTGTWRIVEMEVWRQEDVDLVGPGHFTFRHDGLGSFGFIAVAGDLDCRFSERDGKPFVEFSWTGFDEADSTSGRGWAFVEGDILQGRIFFHCGDDSAFSARRSADTATTPPRARPRGRRKA